MSKAYVAKGCVTSFGPATSSGTQLYPTTVAEVKTIAFGSQKANTEDTTNMDSIGNYIEQLPTTLDAGDITFSGNRIATDAGQAGMLTAFNAQTLIAVSVQLPKAPGQTTKGDLFTCIGYVVETMNNLQYDKTASFSAKVKITGPLTLTPGS